MSRLLLLLSLSLVLSCILCLTPVASGSSSAEDEMEVGESPQAVETTPFSAYEFIAGEWEVYRHLVSYSTSVLNFDHSSSSLTRWSFSRENITANLVGRSFANGTESETGQAMYLEFHDPSSGRFQTGVDEDNLHLLFSFAFVQQKGSIPISVGAYHGAEVAGDAHPVYQFEASSPDRFTLTVTPRSFDLAAAAVQPKKENKKQQQQHASDDEDELSSGGPASTGHPLLSSSDLTGLNGEAYIYIGHRIKTEVPKTLFQQYGTMVLLGAMLLLNVYMRSSGKGTAGAAAGAARGALSSSTTTAKVITGSSKKAGARVEEITEGEIGVGTKKGQ